MEAVVCLGIRKQEVFTMITDEIIKQLKIIIGELEVLDEFLEQFAEEEEEAGEEDEEESEEKPKKLLERKSVTDIFKEKMG